MSFLSEYDREVFVDFASRTVKDMPLPSATTASSDVAVTGSIERPEILPPPKKKSKSEFAMEEFLGKGRLSNSSLTPTWEEV